MNSSNDYLELIAKTICVLLVIILIFTLGFLGGEKKQREKTLPIKQAYCFNDEIKVLTDNNNTIKLIMSLVWLFVIDVIQKQQQIKIFPVQKVLCTDNKADVLIEGKNGSRTWYPIELKYKCTTKDK